MSTLMEADQVPPAQQEQADIKDKPKSVAKKKRLD